MRVFLDTNVLVSALATRGLCADVFRVALNRHQLVVGEAVLMELDRVLPRKLGEYPSLFRQVNDLLRREAEVVGNAPPLDLPLVDSDDLRVIEQAVAGRADVLVTGESGLLNVADQLPLRVVNPRGFWELLRS